MTSMMHMEAGLNNVIEAYERVERGAEKAYSESIATLHATMKNETEFRLMIIKLTERLHNSLSLSVQVDLNKSMFVVDKAS